jgi:hypothetical protein
MLVRVDALDISSTIFYRTLLPAAALKVRYRLADMIRAEVQLGLCSPAIGVELSLAR